MEVLSYSDARKYLKSVMDKVVEDRSEAIITRRNGEAVVMVSLSEWNSIVETEYLLASPENARRLRESIAQLDRGEGVVRELIQP
jgi:antitoxin YefM